MQNRSFVREVLAISVPVAMQSMLQSSFSMIDQIMVGQLGETQVAAVEIAGKPAFIYNVVIGAVATIAGIMISQYIGKKDRSAEEKSICINSLFPIVFGALFMIGALGYATFFTQLFTEDQAVLQESAGYLRIIGLSFIPSGISTLLAVPIRCRGKASWPLYLGILTAGLNTLLNRLLIFGFHGIPAYGVRGAAIASVISQLICAVIMISLFFRLYGRFHFSVALGQEGYRQYLKMLLPILLNEFLWAVGQSINTFVYGHMGTEELAGMSLTSPVQGLMISAMSGLAQAAGILIGKRLGQKAYQKAYKESISLCAYGFAGSILISLLLILLRTGYLNLYHVSADVLTIANQILLCFAILLPIKVGNMILGGGIIRSGGKTKYIMIIDMLGTWAVGVPLVLLCGLSLHLPIMWVYFISSQEELVRYLISVYLFRKRTWMNTID